MFETSLSSYGVDLSAYGIAGRKDADEEIYRWVEDLFPILRSITGEGNRQTLRYIQKLLPDLEIHEVPSGYEAFDWVVPNEWNITEAYIEDSQGNRILDMQDNNLHVMSYAAPMDTYLSLEELQSYLHSREDRPDVIPYVTSYYAERSGFALTHKQRLSLKEDTYHALIKSTLEPGSLTYGELIIPGQTDEEILVSSYICHPQMANNELSGPATLIALARWVQQQKDLKHTYRFILGPETIGAIVYLSKHLEYLKKHVKAGFVLTCIGDDAPPSFVKSRLGKSYADRVMQHVLKHRDPNHRVYEFLQHGGSDDRQYSSPLVDLPVVVVSRSFCDFTAYHTSDDNLSVVKPEILGDSVDIMRAVISIIENDRTYIRTQPCEPQLGKRGLYRTTDDWVRPERHEFQQKFIAYCDGGMSLLDIAEFKDVTALGFLDIPDPLLQHDLIKEVK